jgi:dienelactone hydrolase
VDLIRGGAASIEVVPNYAVRATCQISFENVLDCIEFAVAKVPAEIEVYAGALHGWCVPDMPLQNDKPICSRPDAERAWGKLVALYKTALARIQAYSPLHKLP